MRNVVRSRLELCLCAIPLAACGTVLSSGGDCPPLPDSGETVEKTVCVYWPNDDSAASFRDSGPALDAGASTSDAASSRDGNPLLP